MHCYRGFQTLDYNKGLMSVPTMFQLQVLGTLRTGNIVIKLNRLTYGRCACCFFVSHFVGLKIKLISSQTTGLCCGVKIATSHIIINMF